MSAAGLETDAPAKVNLYLHVTGRRGDGYHLLDSLIAFTACHDVLSVRPGDGMTLTIDGPFGAALDAGGDNLVLRAAKALAALRGSGDGAVINLTKNLPVASGIGGGSTDAAATLRLLDLLWGTDAGGADPDPSLMILALDLGADVPVCLFGRTAVIGGIGEELTPVPALPRIGVVLVNPGVAVPTAGVFADREGNFSPPAEIGVDNGWADADGLVRALAGCGNDLALTAVQYAPVIADVLAALEDDAGCLLARLSGSGATCFGLYGDGVAARAAAGRLAASHPGWWVCETGFIDAPPTIRDLD